MTNKCKYDKEYIDKIRKEINDYGIIQNHQFLLKVNDGWIPYCLTVLNAFKLIKNNCENVGVYPKLNRIKSKQGELRIQYSYNRDEGNEIQQQNMIDVLETFRKKMELGAVKYCELCGCCHNLDYAHIMKYKVDGRLFNMCSNCRKDMNKNEY